MAKHIECEVLRLLNVFRDRLKQIDIESIQSLVEHAEWGIALDDMCSQLFEYDARLTQEEVDDVREVCESIGLDESNWHDLKGLIVRPD